MKRAILTLYLAIAVLFTAAALAQQQKEGQPQPRSGAAMADCRPQAGTSPCDTCHEEKCCQVRHACEAHPACKRFIACLTACPSPPCFEKCGKAPETYLARYACQMERCNTPVCGGPVDACSLCMSTRCVKPFLACWGTPECDEYTTCAGGCNGNFACVAVCKTKHAEGVTLADEKQACVAKECGTACPNGAPLHSGG
jgi:hypothetical protein